MKNLTICVMVFLLFSWFCTVWASQQTGNSANDEWEYLVTVCKDRPQPNPCPTVLATIASSAIAEFLLDSQFQRLHSGEKENIFENSGQGGTEILIPHDHPHGGNYTFREWNLYRIGHEDSVPEPVRDCERIVTSHFTDDKDARVTQAWYSWNHYIEFMELSAVNAK